MQWKLSKLCKSTDWWLLWKKRAFLSPIIIPHPYPPPRQSFSLSFFFFFFISLAQKDQSWLCQIHFISFWKSIYRIFFLLIFAGSWKHNRQEGRNCETFPRGGELLLCGTLKWLKSFVSLEESFRRGEWVKVLEKNEDNNDDLLKPKTSFLMLKFFFYDVTKEKMPFWYFYS